MRTSVICFILLLICSNALNLGAAETATGQYPYTAEVTAYDVNVRAGSSLNYEIMTRLSKGDLILVKGEWRDWYKIRLPEGVLCWVYADLVDEGGFVKRNRVNVRSGAALKYNVMCQLPRDEKISIVKTSPDGKWLGIVPPKDASGWVYKKFLRKKGGQKIYLTYVIRRKGVKELLKEADAFRDTGLKLDYQSIDFEKISGKYRFIVDKYKEFDESRIAAERIKQLIKTQEKLLEQERKRLKALQEAKRQKQQEWEEQKKNLKYKSYRGILRTATGKARESATHVLIREDNRVCYLRSRTINLDDYLHRHLKVWGHVLPKRIRGIPVVVVDKIKKYN